MKIKDLRCTKIFLKNEVVSKGVQEKLFELGCKWCSGSALKVKEYVHFIYINEDLTMAYTVEFDLFALKAYKQVFPNDILNINVATKKEVVLKPGTPVLVRDEDGEEWKYSIFSRLNPRHDEGYPLYICLAPAYRQCIPYEGNQHLLGTEE